MYDFIIIGAGPAGAAAAITAARGGASVLLLDRGRFPRHKVCGEFVSAESLGLLSRLLDSRGLLDQATPIARVRVFLDGRTLQTRVDPPASSIARLDLDFALWNSAVKSGVDARQQAAVQAVTGSGPFVVSASDGQFQARAVINTTGRWSNLTAVSGEPADQSDRWIGLKAHFFEPNPEPSVDLYFFDGGYCGVQPVDLHAEGARHSRVNACAMVQARVASTLPQVFSRHPALEKRSRGWQLLSEPVSTSPLIFRKPQPERDRILLAGDAAGFVDPFVGDGISLALRSGSLAAECLLPFLAGTLSLAEAAAIYRKTYEQRLGPVFRASSQIRGVLRMPRRVRKPIFFVLEHVPAITRYVVSKTR